MAHHYSGPDFGFPHGDARLDVTDLFAFPKPGDESRSIIIMDVHPSAGVNPPGPTTTEPFRPGALYELKIDTNGDLVPDIAYRTLFTSDANGSLRATVRRATGAEAAGMGDGGEVLVADAPVSTADEARVTDAGDYRFFAGRRSDPFFFDAGGALNNMQFTGDDFFADKDVSSMAFELPNAVLGSGDVGLWHRSLLQTDDGGWQQVDRGAHASQAVFFCQGDQKAAYLAGEPKSDSQFIAIFAETMEHTGGYSPERARQAAEQLLPDQIQYRPGEPAKYGENGRGLTDDVSDYFLNIFTNGQVTSDKVGPHHDLLAEFPYLGPPHSH